MQTLMLTQPTAPRASRRGWLRGGPSGSSAEAVQAGKLPLL